MRYPASEPQLPYGLSGASFSAIFNTQQSCLEALTLKRRLKGPSWVLLQKPARTDYSHQVGWVEEGGRTIGTTTLPLRI